MDIVEKKGSYYSYADVRLGQGRENAKDTLRESPDLAREIELTVRQHASDSNLVVPFNGDDEIEDIGEEI
jgi:recombination protein RecA